MIKRNNVQIFWNKNKDLKVTEVKIIDSSLYRIEEIARMTSDLLKSHGNICNSWLDPVTPEMILAGMLFDGFQTGDHRRAALDQFAKIEGMQEFLDYMAS